MENVILDGADLVETLLKLKCFSSLRIQILVAHLNHQAILIKKMKSVVWMF